MANDSKLITVYIPKNRADYIVIGALLDNAGIEYFSLNEGIQSLIGAGAVFNIAAGAIEIQVAEGDVDKAINLINSKPE